VSGAPPSPARQSANLHRYDGEPVEDIRAAWYPYTMPFNLTGNPAVCLADLPAKLLDRADYLLTFTQHGVSLKATAPLKMEWTRVLPP
jgi:hypothetical protein